MVSGKVANGSESLVRQTEILLTEKYGLKHECCTKDFPRCRSTVSGLQLLLDLSDAFYRGIAGRIARIRYFDGSMWGRYICLDLELNGTSSPSGSHEESKGEKLKSEIDTAWVGGSNAPMRCL